MTVPLCGVCMSDLRARQRWAIVPAVPPPPAPKTSHPLLAPVEAKPPVCADCGHPPLSGKFPHALFHTTAADVARLRAELSATTNAGSA